MCDNWLFLLLAVRDVSVAYIRIMCVLKGLQVAARVSGKLKALAQGLGAIILVALFSFGGPVGVKMPWIANGLEHAPLIIEILIALVTFWSLLDYFKAAQQKPAGEPLPK
jgi:phosphatidylglycerophosphate synthase